MSLLGEFFALLKRIYKASDGTLISPTTVFNHSKYESNLALGRHVTVEECVFGKYNKVSDYNYLYRVKVGDFTYMGKSVSIMNATIGKFCSIAQGVCISLGKHPSSVFASTSPVFFSTYKQCGFTFADKSYFEEMGKVLIGNDVWVGVNVIILDNIKIGDGAIIGAGAIVTKDVPNYAIVAGNPARIIRYRFSQEEILYLTKFQWWNRDINWLQDNFGLLHDIKLLMKEYPINGLP